VGARDHLPTVHRRRRAGHPRGRAGGPRADAGGWVARARSACRHGALVERLRPDPTGAAIDLADRAHRRWRPWSGRRTSMTATAPPLKADLVVGLKRLQLAHFRAVAAGQAAVLAGYKVRYTIAADLVETLYRGLADNTVGKVIDGLLRHDAILVDELGFAPLDDIGTQLLFRFVAAAYERRSLGVAS